jgi:hypothetical protein
MAASISVTVLTPGNDAQGTTRRKRILAIARERRDAILAHLGVETDLRASPMRAEAAA